MHKGCFFTAHGEQRHSLTPWTHWEVAILMLPIWIMILMDGWKYKLRGWSLKPKPSNLQTGDVIIWLSTLNCRETHRAAAWCFNLETNKKGIKKHQQTSYVAVIPSSAFIYIKPLPSQSKSLWWDGNAENICPNSMKFPDAPCMEYLPHVWNIYPMYGIFTYIYPMKTKQIPLDPRHGIGRSIRNKNGSTMSMVSTSRGESRDSLNKQPQQSH